MYKIFHLNFFFYILETYHYCYFSTYIYNLRRICVHMIIKYLRYFQVMRLNKYNTYVIYSLLHKIKTTQTQGCVVVLGKKKLILI